MSMSGIRLALRIARRDAQRTKGRSILVVCLLAFPVVAIALGATLYDRFELTTEERLERDLGTAEAAVVWQFDGPIEQEPDNPWLNGFGPMTPDGPYIEPPAHVAGADPAGELTAILPPGSRVVPYSSGEGLGVKTPAGTGKINWVAFDTEDSVAEGMLEVVEGKAPTAKDEVLLSSTAAEKLKLNIGDSVELTDPARSLKVTGLVENPQNLRDSYMVGSAETFPGDATKWFVDAPGPMSWEQVKALNAKGVVVYSKAVSLDPPPSTLPWSTYDNSLGAEAVSMIAVVAGMVILELVLLAGPAFAISAKRRSREYALLAANGATAAQVRRTVLSGGVVLGSIAAVSGVLLGALLATAAVPFIEPFIGHRAGGLRFLIAFTGPLALLAVLTGVLAALVPAFTVARQNVIESLTGRKGVTRSRKRWLFVGISMAAVGVAVGIAGAYSGAEMLLVAAAALAQLGLVLCTPAFIGAISKLGRFLPLSPRIALRDAGRNRASTAPAISAVMAVVAGAIAISAFAVADRTRFDESFATNLPEGTVVASVDIWPGWDNATGKELKLPADADARFEEAKAKTEALIRQNYPVQNVYEVSYAACPPGMSGEDFGCDVQALMPPDRTCPYDNLQGILTEEQMAEAVDNPYCKAATNDMSWGGGELQPGTVLVDGDLLGVVSGGEGQDLANARAIIESGGVVVNDPDYLVDGKVTLVLRQTSYKGDHAEYTDLKTVTVPGYAMTTGDFRANLFLAGAAAVGGLGTEEKVRHMLATTTRVPTVEEEERFTAAFDTSAIGGDITGGPGEGATIQSYAQVVRQTQGIDETTIMIWALAAIAGLVALGATAMATGLAAAEGRRDLGTLAAVGAAPGVRRLLSLCQSGVISLLGAVLGVLAGLGAMFAVIATLNIQFGQLYPREPLFPTAVPWPVLGVALVVIPVIAMLGAGLFTRSRLPVERRAA
ncbi:FtsX-like permease family protein [Phytomonospora sp. NPDC050363]|uniref:ABC transporter permease n=1 Tax=Phytomonospora sp. NPDC050363 TaxID=3155642 RepID=UPI0034104899